MVLTVELMHWCQPMFGKTVRCTVQHRANAATPVMPADDDVFDLQCFHCKLKHGHAIEVRGVDEVRDVPVHEDLAGLEACNDIGRHSTVGATDPEELWRLQSNQALEVAGVLCDSFL